MSGEETIGKGWATLRVRSVLFASALMVSPALLTACNTTAESSMSPGFAAPASIDPKNAEQLAAAEGTSLAEEEMAAEATDDAATAEGDTDPAALAMAASKTENAGVDALTRGVAQNAPAQPVGNLYAADQPAQPATPAGQTPVEVASLNSASAVPVPTASPQAEARPAAEATATASQQAIAEQAPAAPQAVALAEPPTKKSFFGKLFSSQPKPPAKPAAEKKSLREDIKVVRASSGGEADLPGVRMSSLFEIKAGSDEDGEDASGVEMASAAGMARLAPNGLHVQTEKVDIACLRPGLVRVLKTVERHYGRPVVITSGFRSPKHNRVIGGARNSRHTTCEAADIQVDGVSKWALATYLRSMPGRGGVGTYCHTNSVHVDIGTERDWNWRCRRRKK